ncbi:MAG: ribonuclease III [Proteobacteria bacterium]|nr:ribonuclease III [Pseudomonadota bacterium]
MKQNLEALQEVISHRFSQVKLLRTALTHSSFANESPDANSDNERLEYLGDAVLELCMSEILYRKFPEAPEGSLTRMRARLVSEPALADVARDLGLSELLFLGKGEESQGGRERNSLLSDALEAIFGAVFMDGGYAAAQIVVAKVFASRLPEMHDIRRRKDSKSSLQELTQERFKERPVYFLKSSEGPEHAKNFEVEVLLPEGTRIVAQGQNMKQAEQNAAAKALTFLGEKTN